MRGTHGKDDGKEGKYKDGGNRGHDPPLPRYCIESPTKIGLNVNAYDGDLRWYEEWIKVNK